MKQGDGLVLIKELETSEVRHYSKLLMDPASGLSYSEPALTTFHFNSPQGACLKCNGLGTVDQIDIDKVFPNPGIKYCSRWNFSFRQREEQFALLANYSYL